MEERVVHRLQIDLQVCNFIKKRLQHRCFPVNMEKFLRPAFFIKHLRWLLLNFYKTITFNKNKYSYGKKDSKWKLEK